MSEWDKLWVDKAFDYMGIEIRDQDWLKRVKAVGDKLKKMLFETEIARHKAVEKQAELFNKLEAIRDYMNQLHVFHNDPQMVEYVHSPTVVKKVRELLGDE